MFSRDNNKKNVIDDLDWKNKNKEYLSELQRFLDKAEQIEDEEIKNEIIVQMIKCDDVLTNLCQEKMAKVYKECNKNKK